MAKELESGMETLLAAVTDGRTENVRYRQNELHKLHAGLRESADAICNAISSSSSLTAMEAETEFFLAMDSVRQCYATLDFDKSIKDEYLVTTGADNLNRRNGLGLVAIKPSEHSRFYSVVTPLAAAIAGGNCVLLELEWSQKPIDTLLSSILISSLDQDTFYVSATNLQPEHVSRINLLVNQTNTDSQIKSLTAPAKSRSIAVVDRSADIEHAAKAIVSARFINYGTSPYAPDLVLVNDFIGEAFGKACISQAKSIRTQASKTTAGEPDEETKQVLRAAEAKGQVKTHNFAPGLTVVEVTDRSSPILTSKITGPYIITLRSTGLVDSVSTQRDTSTHLATYLFASPSAAKFLSEQLDSSVTYINQIPTQLLIGPPSPQNYPHSLHPRYTPDMFSKPRPQFIIPIEGLPSEEKLREKAIIPLKPTGQRPGHAIGFFEQGILLGLGVTAFVVLPSVSYGLFRLGREGWRYYMK